MSEMLRLLKNQSLLQTRDILKSEKKREKRKRKERNSRMPKIVKIAEYSKREVFTPLTLSQVVQTFFFPGY